MNRLKVYSVHPAKRWVGTDKGRGGAIRDQTSKMDKIRYLIEINSGFVEYFCGFVRSFLLLSE